MFAASLQNAEDQQRREETTIRMKYTGMRQEIADLEAAPRAAAQRELEAIRERRDQTMQLIKRDQERTLEDAKRDLAALDEKIADVRRSGFGLQREKARATARVKAYAPVTFGRYLRYAVFGLGNAA